MLSLLPLHDHLSLLVSGLLLVLGAQLGGVGLSTSVLMRDLDLDHIEFIPFILLDLHEIIIHVCVILLEGVDRHRRVDEVLVADLLLCHLLL